MDEIGVGVELQRFNGFEVLIKVSSLLQFAHDFLCVSNKLKTFSFTAFLRFLSLFRVSWFSVLFSF